jgi:hypothetical protein
MGMKMHLDNNEISQSVRIVGCVIVLLLWVSTSFNDSRILSEIAVSWNHIFRSYHGISLMELRGTFMDLRDMDIEGVGLELRTNRTFKDRE